MFHVIWSVVLSLLLFFLCVQMSKYPGTFTKHLKLTYDKLLSIRPLKQVRKDLITNGVVIELIRLRTVHRLPWRAIIDRIIQLFGKNWPANEPSELTMIKTLSSLYKKYRSLVLKKNLQQSPFHVPCPQLGMCEHLMSHSTSKQVVKRKSIIRKEHEEAFQKAVTDLCNELTSVNTEVGKLRQQFTSLHKKTNTRNINKREKRKLKRLSRQEKTITKLTEDKEKLTYTLNKTEKKLRESEKRSTSKLGRCQKRYYRMKSKYKAKLQRIKPQKMPAESCSASDSAVSDEEEEPVTVVPTFSKGHYNAKVRECCMELLAQNVGIHNVESCINAVCDFVGCKTGPLPSKSTVANIMVEAQAISHVQIAASVPVHSTNTLHSDGTTKFGEKYGGLQITTPDSCYTLCLTTMKAGGASDFKELLANSLSDISSTCKAVGGTDVSDRLLASIKNTMSDRHIVEKKFNELLESYREEVLPQVIDGWNDLTPEQQLQQSVTRVNNFFCGLHFLVGLADTSAETIKPGTG